MSRMLNSASQSLVSIYSIPSHNAMVSPELPQDRLILPLQTHYKSKKNYTYTKEFYRQATAVHGPEVGLCGLGGE